MNLEVARFWWLCLESYFSFLVRKLPLTWKLLVGFWWNFTLPSCVCKLNKSKNINLTLTFDLWDLKFTAARTCSSLTKFILHVLLLLDDVVTVAQSVEHQTCSRELMCSTAGRAPLRSYLRRVIHTYLSLSPRSIIWHWPTAGR